MRQAILKHGARVLLVLILGAASIPPTWSQAQDNSIDYATLAFDELTGLAEKGDATAQNLLGVRYQTGEGVERDIQQANRWYRKAVEGGNHDAQCNLGTNALNGLGMLKDLEQARQLLTLASEGGVAQAQNALGTIYQRGLGTEPDAKVAAQWYRKSADQGFGPAQSNYGTCLLQGQGVARNVVEGLKWIKRSADQGDPNGLHNYGYACQLGLIGRKDLAKAANYYRQASRAGHPDALEKLKQLAASGSPDAQFELGSVFEFGHGAEADFAAARKWYQKAADQDHAASIFKLALCFQHGHGGPKDVAKAVELCRIAARLGNAPALNSLGECYFRGTELEENKKKAAALIRMAADRDLPLGLCNYGWLLQTGAIGDPDPDQAAEFYFRAAARGHNQGETNLRTLADQGNEVASARLKQFEAGDIGDAIAPQEKDEAPTMAMYTPEMVATMQGLLKQYTEGNFNEAIDGLYEYVEQHPQDDIAWNLLGRAYQEKEMPREAKAAMDRAIELKPTNPDYYIAKAGLLDQEGRYHESAKTLEAAIEHAPPALPLLKRLVAIESKAKRLRHVVQYGEVAWALEESRAAAFELAIAHYFLGDESQCDHYTDAYKRLGGESEKLAKIFATSEQLRGDQEKIMDQLGQIGKSGNVEKMLEQVRRYLNYDPCYFEGWAFLGLVYMNHSDLVSNDKARAILENYRDYGKAIEMLLTAYYFAGPKFDCRRELAKAMVDNGEFERAWAEYQKSMEMFPEVPIHYSDAALLALKMGDHEEAVRLAERAYEINDNLLEVVSNLILVYHFTGDTEERDRLRGTVEERVETPFKAFDKVFAANKYWDYGFYGNSALAHDLVNRICEYTSFVAVKGVGTEKYREILGHDYEARLHAVDTTEEELTWRRRQLVRACRSYLEQYPKSFYVHVMYGHLCSCLRRYEEADEHCRRSLETNPDFAPAYFTMGLSSFHRGDRQAAVASFSNAYERDPAFFATSSEPLWRCYWLENDKSYEIGNEYASVLWEANQNIPWIPARLAEGYHHLGDFEKRDEFLEHARKLGYEEMDRLEAMVADSEDGGEETTESAENTASKTQEAMDEQPATPSGNARSEADEHPEPGTATEDEEQVPPVAVGNVRVRREHYSMDVPENWIYPGHKFMPDEELPELSDGIVIPQKRVLGDEGTSIAIYVLPVVKTELVKERKFEEAIRLYNEAIQLDRSHVYAHTGIGWAEGMRGRQQTGMDQMNRTVDMFPQSALARIERGRYALMINRVDICEADADKAIELSYCARAYELRAYCFLERGQDQSAVNYLDMAIRIYPDSANAYRLRARAHRSLGNRTQAEEDESKATDLSAQESR